jgi:hypothetical protein
VIDNSRRAVYGYDQRVEVFGFGGMVTAANDSPDTSTPITGQDGRVPVLMAMAAQMSFVEKRPVKLSNIDG